MSRFRLRALLFAAALLALAPAHAQLGFGPDLTIHETATTTATVGQTVTFTYQVVNAGTTPTLKAKVDTNLPSNISLDNMSWPNGVWDCGGSIYVHFSCYYESAAVVPPGGSYPAFQISGHVVTPGTFHVCSTVTLLDVPGDNKHGNDQSCVNGTVQPKPRSDLSLQKTGPGIATGGLGANFAITVHNGGPSPVNGQSGITVSDPLQANAVTGPVTASGPGWSCAVAGLTVTCGYNGPAVAAGANLPPIAVHAKAGPTGPHYNCATVAMTGGDDPNAANNKACVDFEVRLPQAGSGRN